MKKSILLLLIAVVFISGCVTTTGTSIKNEGILPSFAYVVGKSANGVMRFYRAGADRYKGNNSDNQFALYGERYDVCKVLPGVYHLEDVTIDNGTLSANGRPLLSVSLQPGKITYIGDISFTVSGAAPHIAGGLNLYAGVKQSVSSSKTVQDGSEAAKNAIRERHPELAGSLDTLFIYSPAR